MGKKYSFDTLPESLGEILERLAKLEKLVGELLHNSKTEVINKPILYTRSEVQKILRISKSTIFKISQKDLPYFYIGNDRRYKRKDVDAYLKNRES